MNTSPFLAMQKLDTQLKGMVRFVDVEILEPVEKKALTDIKRLSTDAKLDIRDYELSETREEQLKYAAAAKKRLKKLDHCILAAGNVFGATDVAQLGAQLEQINGWLE